MCGSNLRRTPAGDRALAAWPRHTPAGTMLGLLPSSTENPIGLQEAVTKLRRADGTRTQTAILAIGELADLGFAEILKGTE